MYQCSKKLVTYEVYSCFNHSDFWHIQCLHLMFAEVAWVLVSSGTQVQLQTVLNPGYLTNYFSVSYDYGDTPSLF